MSDHPVSEPAATWGSGRTRLRSVDVMRGAVLALMILTPPIRYAETYPLLEHAAWLGWTISDLVFPLFLFVSGLSLAFLLRPPVTAATRRRLVRRFVLLLLLGIAYNAIGEPLAFSTLRLTGVLQLIGISGAVAAAVILISRKPDGGDRIGVIAAAAGALIAGYGAVLFVSPGYCDRFGVNCNPLHFFDRMIIGRAHLYHPWDTISYDPEGLAVSVAAGALVLTGYLAARTMMTQSIKRSTVYLVASGSVGLGAALMLHRWIPISKRLFTPTFALLAASIGTLLFVLLVAAFDLESDGGSTRRVSRVRGIVAWPFVTLGSNALVVFFAERIILQTLRRTTVGGQATSQWLLEHFGSAPSAALGLSTALLAVIFTITAVMRRRRWRIVL